MNDIMRQLEDSRALSDALLHRPDIEFDDDELIESFKRSAMLQELSTLGQPLSKTDWAVEMYYSDCPCGPESYDPPS